MIENRSIEDLKFQIDSLKKENSYINRVAFQYQSSFQNSRDAITIFSLDYKILDVNDSLIHLSKYSRKELLSMQLEDLYPEILSEQGVIRLENLKDEKKLPLFESYLITKNKEKIPVEITLTSLKNRQGKEIVYQGNIRDISQKKQVQNKLKRTEIKYRGLIENLDAGISRWTPGPEGKYIKVNQSMETLLGYSKEEFFDTNIFKLYADPEQADAVYKKIEANGSIKDKEIKLRHKNGSQIFISYTGKSVKDPNSNIIYIDDILVDITARKKNEDEIQRTERLDSIGALAGGIAHHFNNIMTGLYGNISLAKTELSQNEEAAAHYLENAEECMQEGIQLTKQLLTFAKGGDPIKEVIDIMTYVKDAAMFNLSGSTIKLNFSSQKDLWPIRVDRAQINQVFSNIVTNARQAMPDGGQLKIHVEKSDLLKDNLLTIFKGKYIKVTITDNGPGIHQKDLERIFDPYFTTHKNGSGMGLSICYSIVKKHEGHISVSSQLGRGTTITIYLPAILPKKTKEVKMQPANPTLPSNEKFRILVMDDEDHIRKISKRMLEKFGYIVELAIDGEDAIARYKKLSKNNTPAHLVIMDLTIPGGMGGKEASKIILDLDPKAKIVVSSGYSNDPIMASYKDFGLKGIIPKPYRMDELKSAVKKAIEQD
ncbi:MAG: PAS domain S-box protein [Desulfobacteraceae bacterium]|nr:PAS domain S-box protein [Desulfobacteraceae bacterium]